MQREHAARASLIEACTEGAADDPGQTLRCGVTAKCKCQRKSGRGKLQASKLPQNRNSINWGRGLRKIPDQGQHTERQQVADEEKDTCWNVHGSSLSQSLSIAAAPRPSRPVVMHFITHTLHDRRRYRRVFSASLVSSRCSG